MGSLSESCSITDTHVPVILLAFLAKNISKGDVVLALVFNNQVMVKQLRQYKFEIMFENQIVLKRSRFKTKG